MIGLSDHHQFLLLKCECGFGLDKGVYIIDYILAVVACIRFISAAFSILRKETSAWQHGK